MSPPPPVHAATLPTESGSAAVRPLHGAREAGSPRLRLSLELQDRALRAIGVPFFGISIPRVTGLLGDLTWSDTGYWTGTAWFVLVSLALWQGNRWLFFRQRDRYKLKHPRRKIAAMIATATAYTVPVSVAMLTAWYALGPFAAIDWITVARATAVVVVAVLFVTHAYETVLLLKERLNDRLEFERAEQARLRAELAALKSQLTPHFLFNCLNTLGILIDDEPQTARAFNVQLARVCRFLLLHKSSDLVTLAEELEFLDAYLGLVRIRFGEALQLRTTGVNDIDGRLLIPPASLQLLVENAIKHNRCTTDDPLPLEIALKGDTLVITNPVRPAHRLVTTTGIGLKNLGDRLRLVAGRSIGVEATAEVFRVTLPLVRKPH